MHLSRDARAAMIREIDAARERLDTLLAILLPDDAEGCPHAQILDVSTMGEERYQCAACGAVFDHHPHATTPSEE